MSERPPSAALGAYLFRADPKKVIDPNGVETAHLALNAIHHINLFLQQFSEVAAVLVDDTSDQGWLEGVT